MPDSCFPADSLVNPSMLWMDLTQGTENSVISHLDCGVDIRRVTSLTQIRQAIQYDRQAFLCFQVDEGDPSAIGALTQARREHPRLPIFLMTRGCSEQLALCALRVRVWDWVILPVPLSELRERIDALATMARKCGEQPARDIVFPPQCCAPAGERNSRNRHNSGSRAKRRISASISHVTAHFDSEITLEQVAHLCRLSPSQFCRAFRQVHGTSFGQYLMRYRIDRACECLAKPDAVVKNVAYSVGFADHSYFSRAFRRRIGVSPSEFHVRAQAPFAQSCPNDCADSPNPAGECILSLD